MVTYTIKRSGYGYAVIAVVFDGTQMTIAWRMTKLAAKEIADVLTSTLGR